VLVAAVALLAGLIVGYTVGHRHTSAIARRVPRAHPTASLSGPIGVGQLTGQCSTQLGRTLELGVQVTNQSGADVTLRRVTAQLPLRGLKAISESWGPCGELDAASSGPVAFLPAGASTWLTVTFRVLVKCPAPLPVQFTLDYNWRGRPVSTHLPGFPDLSQVPYAGCSGP
jgi:hypothetical protein